MANLNKISQRTLNLWYKVNKKYGNHIYTLGVNGLNQVVLSRGYSEDIAVGTKDVNNKLIELLKRKEVIV